MRKFIVILLLIFGGFAEYSSADVLIIERIKNSQSKNIPSRGISMDQVIAEYGEPNLRRDAIGEPPITVWQYSDFSVYFEKTWVINSVINKSSPEEKGPKPIEN